MMTAGIIIQARLTSKRFPNKVLCRFHGKAIIEWVIDECIKTGLPICVAIPSTKPNQPLANFLEVTYAHRPQVITVYKGAEEDCLTRYIVANQWMKFDPIIRICGDSPFVSTEDIALALDLYNKRKYLTMINHVQVLGRDELKYADLNDPFMGSREHVVRSLLHTVDYPEDIERFYDELLIPNSTLNKRLTDVT